MTACVLQLSSTRNQQRTQGERCLQQMPDCRHCALLAAGTRSHELLDMSAAVACCTCSHTGARHTAMDAAGAQGASLTSATYGFSHPIVPLPQELLLLVLHSSCRPGAAPGPPAAAADLAACTMW